jgi:Family of unknown function (DUF5684)
MGLIAQTTTSDTSSGFAAGTFFFIWLAFIVVYAAASWQMYVKAGEAGWKALIPFYNWYILMKIVGRPGWWLILLFIPFVNLVIWIIVSVDLSKSFGHGVAFALGLIFLSFIFILILGFGPSRYLGPAGPEGASMTPPPMPA